MQIGIAPDKPDKVSNVNKAKGILGEPLCVFMNPGRQTCCQVVGLDVFESIQA